MRYHTAAAVITAAALLTIVGCTTEAEPSKPADKPSADAPTEASSVDSTELTPEQEASIRAAAGLPEKPVGEKRTALLAAIAKAAPDAVRYEDKAVDAARNQCSAINNGSDKVDWLASQRFTYKDVTTTEAQGKAINEALKDIGFCNV
ncbi:hypothetical protein [Streptomyces sp. PR69]|uniref:hypothetical protein n=1 Tax=Streptomyces sp. PR69 TaxID=2984950 RepID=UPI0022652FFA|nr:hypothetical protein [Streptomyces sp. PR69]